MKNSGFFKVMACILALVLILGSFSVVSAIAQERPENTHRYYFYMPEEWYNDYATTAGIYWWEGTDACSAWPGYEAHKADAENVYYYDVPTDVTMIIWNNFVDGGTDSEADIYTSEYKTVNIGSEYYDPGESENYPEGTDSFDEMIYVIDPALTEVNEYSGKSTFAGEWYYYYGNGEYGFEKPYEPEEPEIPEETLPTTGNASVTVNGETNEYEVGSIVTYTVNLTMSNIMENIQAYVSYDSRVLQLSEIDRYVAFPNSPSTIYSNDDESGVFYFNDCQVRGLDFTEEKVLVTLDFLVIGAGEASIGITVEDITGTDGNYYVMSCDIVREGVSWSESIKLTQEATADEATADEPEIIEPLSLSTYIVPVWDTNNNYVCHRIKAEGEGGVAPYEYRMDLFGYVIDYSTQDEISICIEEDGKYAITVDVKDSQGTVMSVTTVIDVNVHAEKPEETTPSVPTEYYKVYFENYERWEKVYVYAWNAETGEAPLGLWPGTQAVDEGNGIWSLEIPDTVDGIVFNNDVGRQTNDLVAPDSTNTAVWVSDDEDRCIYEWAEPVATEPTEPVDTSPIKVYFDNSDNLTQVYASVYAGESGSALVPWPGELCVDEGDGVWSIEIPYDCVSIIFNDNNGYTTYLMENPGTSMIAKKVSENNTVKVYDWFEYAAAETEPTEAPTVVTEPTEVSTATTEPVSNPGVAQPTEPTEAPVTTTVTEPVETTAYTEPVTEAPVATLPVKVVTDEKTQISIETDTDADIKVVEINSKEQIAEIDLILVGEKVGKLFDITLSKNGVEVQPDNTVKVMIPAENKNSRIYRVENDGTLTDMKATYKDGFLVFTTEHFSLYVVAEAVSASSDDEPQVDDKGILGDVNGDGKVNIKDATTIQKSAAKLIELAEAEQIRADVNADTKINIKDATAIQKYVAKIETDLHIGAVIF